MLLCPPDNNGVLSYRLKNRCSFFRFVLCVHFFRSPILSLISVPQSVLVNSSTTSMRSITLFVEHCARWSISAKNVTGGSKHSDQSHYDASLHCFLLLDFTSYFHAISHSADQTTAGLRGYGDHLACKQGFPCCPLVKFPGNALCGFWSFFLDSSFNSSPYSVWNLFVIGKQRYRHMMYVPRSS